MTLPLAKLQSLFSDALRYNATGEECHVVSDTFSADERVQIYRNNFIISLSEVLQASYPMVLALVGEECFTQLARQHVLDHPLTSGDVSHYGEHFSHTINKFPAVIKAAPYITDVAEFEWQMDKAQQLHDNMTIEEASMPLALLSDIPENKHADIQLHLQPGVLPFQSEFAVFSLKVAVDNQQYDDLVLDQAEQGVICHLAGNESWSLALTPEPFQLLLLLHSGARLGDIPAECLSHLSFLLDNHLVAGFSLKG